MGEKFSRALIAWYKLNKRDLPWRETRDPYRIWLSEVILQQTQVAQGLAYYNKFISKFPTVQALAAAKEDEVLRCWQGLGYYSRARNLHASANTIVESCGGVFPGTYETILGLKGIGTYTASAISSFAYDLPRAVVDGNVYRVLARVFGIEQPTDTAAGKKAFSDLAALLLDRRRPALYNQAIMEFGALYCRPSNPDCGNCIFNASCAAFAAGKVHDLPLKSKRVKVRERHFNYLVVSDRRGRILLNRRKAGDIWQGLYEFSLVETSESAAREEIFSDPRAIKACGTDFHLRHVSAPYTHVLTHQRLYGTFYVIKAGTDFPQAATSAGIGDLGNFAFPRLITRFLEDCDLKEIV